MPKLRDGETDAPSGIRTRATTLKGWRPGPLVEGGGRRRIAAKHVYTGRRGPVAQLVEQGTFNPKVTGSIPVRPTVTACRQRRDSRRFRANSSKVSVGYAVGYHAPRKRPPSTWRGEMKRRLLVVACSAFAAAVIAPVAMADPVNAKNAGQISAICDGK